MIPYGTASPHFPRSPEIPQNTIGKTMQNIGKKRHPFFHSSKLIFPRTRFIIRHSLVSDLFAPVQRSFSSDTENSLPQGVLTYPDPTAPVFEQVSLISKSIQLNMTITMTPRTHIQAPGLLSAVLTMLSRQISRPGLSFRRL